MKLTLAACTLLILFGIVGCGSEEKAETVQNEPVAAWSDDQLVYEDAANKLVGTFMRDLKSELLTAMNTGGPVKAIQICNTKAPEIAAAHSVGGWNIKRVSDRFRNPDNRADTTELAILARFADTTETAEVLTDWTEIDSSHVFHMYKPIHINQVCLNCHGGVQTLGTGVYKKLKKNYPADRAIGYKNGELRGMFVVEAVWPDGLEQAHRIIYPDTVAAPAPDTTALDSIER